MLVWITRSQPGADRQAAALRRQGHRALVAPVVTISPVPGRPPPGPFTDIVFLSEHAVRFGVDGLKTAGLDLGSLDVFAVGSATAARLAEMGVSAAIPQAPSSEGLLAMPEFAKAPGRAVLIVAGEAGRDVLALGLQDRGARTRKLSVYRRQPVDRLADDLSGVEAIAVGSGDGFEIMARLWFAAGGSGDVPVFVPSARVAALGGQLGFSRVHVCAGAGADALLEGLSTITGNG